MANLMISIAKDFSEVPGGRHYEDGDFSGQRFREEFLVPALKEVEETGRIVTIDLEGAEGYPSGFLEEAFGGLVREHGFTRPQLQSLLKIEATNSYKSYADCIWDYISQASE